jgi:hypothetical protein
VGSAAVAQLITAQAAAALPPLLLWLLQLWPAAISYLTRRTLAARSTAMTPAEQPMPPASSGAGGPQAITNMIGMHCAVHLAFLHRL